MASLLPLAEAKQPDLSASLSPVSSPTLLSLSLSDGGEWAVLNAVQLAMFDKVL